MERSRPIDYWVMLLGHVECGITPEVPVRVEPHATSSIYASAIEQRRLASYSLPMDSDVDVLVVGGGPAGLAVAERAARAGRTLVVHQDAEIGRPVRTSGGSWKAHLVALGIPSRFYREIDRLMIAAPGRRMEVSFG